MNFSIYASKKFAALVLAAAAFSATSLASTENASAIYAGGSYAKPTNPADDTCATYSYGFLTNSCSANKSFIMQLPFSSEGYKNISYVAQGVSATSDVSCKASSWSVTGGGFTTTATVSLPSASGAQTVSLGSLYVWNPGTFYLLCTLAPGAKLFMASWDQ
jgi:hypothetical protein